MLTRAQERACYRPNECTTTISPAANSYIMYMACMCNKVEIIC
jgi:hypothetical protein